MASYVMRRIDGELQLVPKHLAPPLNTRPARSDLPIPMVISDQLDRPLKSMANGKYYSSKRGLRATYQPSGNPQGKQYTEVGNEYEKTPYQKPEPKIDAKAIDTSLNKALARYKAGDRPSSQKGI